MEGLGSWPPDDCNVKSKSEYENKQLEAWITMAAQPSSIKALMQTGTGGGGNGNSICYNIGHLHLTYHLLKTYRNVRVMWTTERSGTAHVIFSRNNKYLYKAICLSDE